MKKGHRLLGRILRITGAYRICGIFIGWFLISAAVIWLTEPTIRTLWDSIWYCFTVVSTVGFGDNAATCVVPRLITMLLSFYSIFFFALLTAIITDFVIEAMKRSARESAGAFLDKLERLPELSKEELKELAAEARKLADKKS